MTKPRWIHIPIEIQRREMDAKLVVSAIAAARGYKILIGQDRIVRRLARFLPNGLIFDKSIGAQGDKKTPKYTQAGHVMTTMDEEATGFVVAPELFMETRLGDDTLALTKRWFCISDPVRDMCIERYPRHKDCFVTTGLPRTDTWREPLLGMYDAEVKRIKDEFGPFFLFNSNFGVPNHARGKKFVNNQVRKSERAHKGASLQYDQLLEENAANMWAYAEVIPKILEWFPNHKVIIRPHPAEDVEFWKDQFKSEPRAIVDDRGVVTPWIIASDCMIHHGCTTGIEAEIMSQAQVNYAPLPDIHHDTDMAKTFSRFVYTVDELKMFLNGAIEKDDVERMPADGQSKYFASLHGKLVSEKIVDEFDKICFTSEALPSWLNLLKYTPRHLAAAFKDITPRAKAYSAQKFKGSSVAEIDEKLNFVNKSLGLNMTFKSKQIFHNLFMIETV